MTIQLRDYQTHAVDMLREAIRTGSRAPCLVAPTGMGKTRTAAAIIESTITNGKRALFIAPRRNLVEQTHREFKKLGIDSAMIMAGVHFDPCQRVEIASIDTIMARLDNPYSNGVTALQAADVILIDEAHTCASEQRGKLINDLREGVYGPRKIVILLTATPCTTGGGGLGNISDRLVIPVTMPELIEGGHLLQPRYYSAERPDLTGVKMVGDDYNSKQLGAAYDGKIMGCVVDNWLKIASGTSTVVFTATRANAADVVDKFNAIGVSAAYVDANTPDEERQMIFDGIESGRILVIANVMIIGMGTDIPRLQTVSFATATKSIPRWMQGVGRVLRPYDGQEWATVIDHGGMVLDPSMGPVEFINDWSLDGSTTVQERVEKRKQEKKEPVDVACPACNYTFRAAHVCPKCGHQRKKKGEALEYHDVDLKQVDTGKLSAAEKRNRTMSWEEKIRLISGFKWYAEKHGYKDGWVYHNYKQIMSVWPNDARLRSAVPSAPADDIMGFIKNSLIRGSYASKKTA